MLGREWAFPADVVPVRSIAPRVFDVAAGLIDVNDLAVFLCGKAASDNTSVRARLRNALRERRQTRKERVLPYYPEEVFVRAAAVPGAEQRPGRNLLDWENWLALSAHAIVVVVESWGAACELGAFTNNGHIRDRVIAVADEQYRWADSFISRGPLEHLRARSGVIYHDFSNVDERRLAERVVTAVRKLKRPAEPDRSFDNLVLADLFALLSAYLVSPISRKVLQEMFASSGVPSEAATLVETSTSSLQAQRLATRAKGGWVLTPAGDGYVRDLLPRHVGRYKHLLRDLDDCRIIVLNTTLRRMPRRGERFRSVQG